MTIYAIIPTSTYIFIYRSDYFDTPPMNNSNVFTSSHAFTSALSFNLSKKYSLYLPNLRSFLKNDYTKRYTYAPLPYLRFR